MHPEGKAVSHEGESMHPEGQSVSYEGECMHPEGQSVPRDTESLWKRSAVHAYWISGGAARDAVFPE